MSARAECWAQGAGVPSATHRTVLLALAGFADEHDHVVVDVSVLMRFAVTDRRRVWRTVRDLQAAGLLQLDHAADVAWLSGQVPATLLVPDEVARPWALSPKVRAS